MKKIDNFNINKFYNEYKEKILYLFFGGFTTILNILIYYLFYHKLNYNNISSNIIAWVVSVMFAYITNKIWVFNSKSYNIKTLLYELSTFLFCRIVTGAMDIIIMFLTVDLLNFNGLFMKFFSNVIVIISNFIFSKLVIFKK